MSYQYPSSVGDFDSNWSCVLGVWNFISMSTTPVKDPDSFFSLPGSIPTQSGRLDRQVVMTPVGLFVCNS